MSRTAPATGGPVASASVFAAGLRAELETLGAFIVLLQAEQEALVRGDAERLAALAPDKAARIDLLAHLGEQRKRHLEGQNLTDNADGMHAWLSRNHGLAAAVRETWRELLTHAETARQLNQSNGLMIDSRLQQNRLQLAVLQSAAASEGVYRADGQLRPLRGARSFSQV
jgi:flagella synthesis protein FlgN